MHFDADERHHHETTTGPVARSLYQSGVATVWAEDNHLCIPSVTAWTQCLLESMATPMTARCGAWASPKGEGSGLHFDSKQVIIVQLLGEKTWTLAPNEVLPYPPENLQCHQSVAPHHVMQKKLREFPRTMPGDAEEIVLTPGSVPREQAAAVEWILDRDGPFSSAELAAAAHDLEYQAVNRILAVLVQQGGLVELRPFG